MSWDILFDFLRLKQIEINKCFSDTIVDERFDSGVKELKVIFVDEEVEFMGKLFIVDFMLFIRGVVMPWREPFW